jgi:hypothetical protein
MSTINTNPINVNYPVPGVNNNSQGFRDNFASIVTNLNTAATEITDLQNKVVVKQALTGTTINNDMANTLISNASTRSFRATTYNLGNAMAGTVFINVALADVHYGALAGNTTFNFSSWAPAGTQSNVQLNINVPANVAATANSVITFSGNVVLADANNGGSSTLENFSNVGGVVSVTVPYGVTQLNYLISTTDCGNTLYIAPINRPRVATAIQQRSPIPTGFKGDVAGDVAVDATYIYVATGTYDSNIANTTQIVQTYASGNIIRCNSWPSNGGGFIANAPIIFNGTSFGNIVAGTTYYIKTVSNPNITISSTGFDGTPGNAVALSDATGSMAADSYNGSTIWKRVDLATTTGNDIVTGNLTVSGYTIGSVTTGISAAGTVQANATAITTDNNIVSTVASGAGVKLPTAVAGMRIYIKNTSANAVLVYPATSAIINSLSTNAAYSQAANASAFYTAATSTQWYSY